MILNIFSLESAQSTIVKKVDSNREKVYSDFCSGNINISYKTTNIKHIGSELIYVLTKNGQIDHFRISKKTLSNFESSSEVDRLLSANVLMMARDNNIEQIKKLISFKSDNQINESYRIYFNGLLNIYLGDFKGGFELIKKAIEVLPYSDEGMLLSLYYVGSNISNATSELQSYSKVIEKLPRNNAMKYLLQANELALFNGWEAKAVEIGDLISQAYQLCPDDPDIALSYAALLESKFQTEAAKDILLRLISNHEYYNPEIDIRLMQYYFDKKDIEKTELYLKRAKKSYLYLGEHNQKAVTFVEQTLSGGPIKFIFGYIKFFTLNGLIFMSVLLLAVIIVAKKYLNKKQRK